jgi:hypothetical protein
MHLKERHRQRALWDAELVQLATAAQSGGSGISARTLSKFISRYFFFSRLTATRFFDANVNGNTIHQSAANVALRNADLIRFRHLTKLLLASLRTADRSQHIGTLIITGSNGYGSKQRNASHWIHQIRKIVQIVLVHLSDVAGFGMEAVSNEILLSWLLFDSTQWPFIKTSGQVSAEEKGIIQHTQAALVASLVIGSAYDRRINSVSSVAASASSSATSGLISAPVDLFHSIRVRLLSLTHMERDGTSASTMQLQHKTSVALLIAIVIRCMTVTASQSITDAIPTSAQHAVHTSFVYHILSIPALPARLRYMGLSALLPSFVTPPVFDGAMSALTREVRLANLNMPTGPLSFKRNVFKSPSYTAYDDASIAISLSAPIPLHSSAAAASSSASSSVPMDLTSFSPLHGKSTMSTAAAHSSSLHSSTAVDAPTRVLSGVAWLLGNCLELVTLFDESKSEAASRSFSHFLTAIDQLIQAVGENELPVLGQTNDKSPSLPPVFIQQCAIFGERTFLDRLCRRLLNEPTLTTDIHPTSDGSISSNVLSDVPIICVLIDSILYKWGVSSSSILNTLVFSSGIVKPLWISIQKSGILDRIAAAGKAAPPSFAPITSSSTSVSSASSSSSSSSHSALSSPTTPSASTAVLPLDTLFATDRYFQLLPLFCTLYSHFLLIQDDEEFFVRQYPFPLTPDISSMVICLKTLLYHLFWAAYSPTGISARLRERFSKLFVQLRDRQSRRPFLSQDTWLFSSEDSQFIPIQLVQQELQAEEQMKEDILLTTADMGGAEDRILPPPGRSSSLVNSIPFVLSFSDRVKLLYAHIELDKQRVRGGGIQFDHGLGRRVTIRRNNILEDGFESLYGLSSNELKGRIQINFIDEHGLEEAGLDGGGLVKEFLTTLMTRAFDPNYTLFSETSEHFLYPNPASLDLPIEEEKMMEIGNSNEAQNALEQAELMSEHIEQILQYMHFLGAMVGKALYDGIQFEQQFTLFFLRSCLGLQNYIDDLQGLDIQIYNSLMILKSMKTNEEIESLGLTFVVERHVYGSVKSFELIPNGKNIPVTLDNKMRFIYLMSDYYLSKQISRQVRAFQRGMWSILSPDKLRLFAAEEMRLLLSGSAKINLTDLQLNTNYSSGYTKDHELIIWFWEVLNEFSSEQISSFLRFTTSCSRAPLLGFRFLSPLFCIQRVNIDELEQNLPTAATCMNLLRMPRYSSKEKLRMKLTYAVRYIHITNENIHTHT